MTHKCNWPGCTVVVENKVWGCRPHWFALPQRFRDRMYGKDGVYRPGQERLGNPSNAYKELEADILEHIKNMNTPKESETMGTGRQYPAKKGEQPAHLKEVVWPSATKFNADGSRKPDAQDTGVSDKAKELAAAHADSTVRDGRTATRTRRPVALDCTETGRKCERQPGCQEQCHLKALKDGAAAHGIIQSLCKPKAAPEPAFKDLMDAYGCVPVSDKPAVVFTADNVEKVAEKGVAKARKGWTDNAVSQSRATQLKKTGVAKFDQSAVDAAIAACRNDEPCTEPDRANCPRLCGDFCNKAEIEKAGEALRQSEEAKPEELQGIEDENHYVPPFEGQQRDIGDTLTEGLSSITVNDREFHQLDNGHDGDLNPRALEVLAGHQDGYILGSTTQLTDFLPESFHGSFDLGNAQFPRDIGPTSYPQHRFVERDPSKPAEEQGLFNKYHVFRNDGQSWPGAKHDGCEYFVLDTDHDEYAGAALRAYARACRATHPQLADDLEARWGRDDTGILKIKVEVDTKDAEAALKALRMNEIEQAVVQPPKETTVNDEPKVKGVDAMAHHVQSIAAQDCRNMDIPHDWTFHNSSIANNFDKHVREQLPWYDLATGVVSHFGRHYLPENGRMYDIGASTGNITLMLKNEIEKRHVRAISIDNSEQMRDVWRGVGEFQVADATKYDFESFDFGVCFLLLMFLPPVEQREMLHRMYSKLNPGGALVIFDKTDKFKGYLATVVHRLTMAGKVSTGVPADEIVKKELSLAGIQRPIDVDRLLFRDIDATEIFRFGEFAGWIITK